MKIPSRWCLTLTALCLAVPPFSAASQRRSSRPSHVAAKGETLTVAKSTIIPMVINNTINSHSAYVGEAVYCETIYPVTEGDHLLIPARSFVRGSVVDVTKPGKIKGKAQLTIRFDSLTLPDGVTRPIQAAVYSLAGTRLTESKASEDAAEQPEGTGMAEGAAGDAVIDASGLGGASPLSAATQGVGGLALMLVTRGKTILLRPGTTLEIQLLQPLALPRVSESPHH